MTSGRNPEPAGSSSPASIDALLHAVPFARNQDAVAHLVAAIRQLDIPLSPRQRSRFAQSFRHLIEAVIPLARKRLGATYELELHLFAGSIYARLDSLDLATLHVEQAIALSRELPSDRYLARAQRLLGDLHFQAGSLEEAIRDFRESQKVSEESGEFDEEAFALHRLASAYARTGAWQALDQVCRQAQDLAETVQDVSLRARIRFTAGLMHMERGDCDAAESVFRECLSLFERSGEDTGIAECYLSLSQLYRDRAMLREAARFNDRALQFARSAGDGLLQARAKLSRAELYVHKNDPELAEKLCRDALALFRLHEDRSGQAESQRLLGAMSLLLGNAEVARQALRDALVHFAALGRLIDLADCYILLARAEAHLRQHRRAIDCLHKALVCYQRQGITDKMTLVGQLLAEYRQRLQEGQG